MNADIGRSIIEQEQAENRRLRALIQQQECEHAEQEAALQAEIQLAKAAGVKITEHAMAKIHECKHLRGEVEKLSAACAQLGADNRKARNELSEMAAQLRRLHDANIDLGSLAASAAATAGARARLIAARRRTPCSIARGPSTGSR